MVGGFVKQNDVKRAEALRASFLGKSPAKFSTFSSIDKLKTVVDIPLRRRGKYDNTSPSLGPGTPTDSGPSEPIFVGAP